MTLGLYGQFTAQQVGSHLSHQAITGQFTSGDTDEAIDSIALEVVEKHYAAADVTPARVVVAGHKWTNSGIGTWSGRVIQMNMPP